MGAIVSRFRKKKSTIEILEGIDKEIERLQKFRLRNQQRQKRFIASLLLYSILLYIVAALVFYFYYFPDKWKARLLYSIPLLIFPVLIFCAKKLLHWYFVKRIAGNDMALSELREQKKQILEDVMETETYKKAREILEKFDPNRFKELEHPKATPSKQSPPGTELRQRSVGQRSPPGSQQRMPMTPRMPVVTPMRPTQQPTLRGTLGATPYGPRLEAPGVQPRNLIASPQPSQHNGYGTPQGPPLPRPILPRERGTVDRLLEYLVGDGPQNRYALICRNCHSHNGMALKEEFEFLDFRCCYCNSMNPARRKRPFAPRIEPPTPRPRAIPAEDQADEEGSDESDEDEDEGEGDGGEGEEEEGAQADEEDSETEESSGVADGGTDDRLEESMDTENLQEKGSSGVPDSTIKQIEALKPATDIPLDNGSS